MNKILFIGAHTDDVDLACGGTISRFIEEGKEVFYLALSTCHEPVRLENECRKACETFNLKPENVIIQHFEVRKFFELRQHILDYLIDLQEKHEFGIVFTHSTNDNHRDHSVTGEESLRAFRGCMIYTYEQPWNSRQSFCNTYFQVTDIQMTNKVNALWNYHSQVDREYMKEEFIRSWGIYNGIKCGSKYAEAFELIQWIM